MTRLLDAVPGWVWALLCAGLAASNVVNHQRLAHERAAHAETRTAHAEAESAALREIQRELARQIQLVQGAQDAYQTQRQAVLALRDRLRAADQRLRDQQTDLDARIAAASAEGLRRYAAAAGGDLARCRADVERFGLEAAACSATAHALKANLDAVNQAP